MRLNELPTRGYRCYGFLDSDGRWRPWRFAPATRRAMEEATRYARKRGLVLFVSVQIFPPPVGFAGLCRWKEVDGQYKGEAALPHGTPLYFDIDAEGDIEKALALVRSLAGFFTATLALPPDAVRVWFSGSKGFHLLVSPTAMGIEPSPTLTSDMKAVALGLCRRLHDDGAPDLEPDRAVYSLPRMLRAPDEVNPKTGLHKVELHHEELLHLTPQQIAELARASRGNLWQSSLWEMPPVAPATAWWADQLRRVQEPRRFRRRTAELTGEQVRPDGFVVDELLSPDIPDCVRQILSAIVTPGRRNRCELQVACWGKGAGRTLTETIDILARWVRANRSELTAAEADRKAESVARSVYVGSHYGFSCAASRLAAQDSGLIVNCAGCRAVRRRALKQLASLREGENAEWVPTARIELEDARARIAGSLGQFFDELAGRDLPRDDAAGDGEDLPGPAPARRTRGSRRLCGAHA